MPEWIRMKIHFHGGSRLAARYVSAATVYEEALHNTGLVGLYGPASGQVQRKNVAATLPAADPASMPLPKGRRAGCPYGNRAKHTPLSKRTDEARTT